jgi:quercetin dioxygenase-like cupin family protein
MMADFFVQQGDRGHHTLFPGVEAYTMAGERLMLSWVDFEPHAVVPAHSHPHEQIGVLLDGELVFQIADQQRTLGPGDMWRIPGGVVHGVEAGSQGARALDVFHPVRQEYL